MFDIPTPYTRGLEGPTPEDYVIAPGEDEVYLSGIAESLALSELSDEDKCLTIMRYVASLLGRMPNTAGATQILKDRHANCDGYARVFCVLGRIVGLPTREAAIYGLKSSRITESHCAAECFYAESWHFFDPYFGIFFRSEDTGILSFADLLNSPESGAMCKVVDKPWAMTTASEYYLDRPVERDWLNDIYWEGLPARYPKWFKSAYPVNYRRSTTVFPLDINLVEKRDYSCCNPGFLPVGDGDVTMCTDSDSGWSSVGFAFSHAIFCTVPLPRTRVEVKYVFSEEAPEIDFCPVRDCRVLARVRSGKEIAFTIDTVSANAVGLIAGETFGRLSRITASIVADGVVTPEFLDEIY